jgi:hypothetical protein
MTGPTPPPGPQHPLTRTPARVPGSVRRTTTIDITFPDGIGERVVADVRGRDLRTNADGTFDVLEAFAVTITFEAWTMKIVSAEGAEELAGLELNGTFAPAVIERFPDDAARRSVFYSALEDLRGAQLVSGYAALREGLIPDDPTFAEITVARQSDICVGWAGDGSVIETLRTFGHNPIPVGPPAPSIDDDDPLGWHAVAPLALHTVRRRRRTEVTTNGDGMRVEHHFRDSHCGRDTERVMHEYLVDATFGADTKLATIAVDARVLPWHDCPGATASAPRLIGVALDEFPTRVRSEFRGVTTCTHLNSTLRTLADAHALR